MGFTKWLPLTYDLQTEMDVFLGQFYERKRRNIDNFWILKPPNLARSMDMIVTDNLDLIVRSIETGPKIAQKYIHNPVTLNNKKIDLRYIVMLKSV